MSETQVIYGSCLDGMATLDDNSIDAIVTDPPYGLSKVSPDGIAKTLTKWATGERDYIPDVKGFNGKSWDAFVPPPAVWDECYRVLKPGGHLLAFAGSRTADLMALSIRFGGFEIRDTIAWTYATGFPKSLDVTNEMEHYLEHGPTETADKTNPDIYRVTAYLKAARDTAGWNNTQIDNLFGTKGMAGHWTTQKSQPAVPSIDQWATLKKHLPLGDDMDELVAEHGATERPDDWGQNARSTFLSTLGETGSPAGKYGTALKPAYEPIIMARKQTNSTIAKNVLAHGTGALNLSDTRVGGRWPANMIADETAHDELIAQGAPPAFFYVPKPSPAERAQGNNTHPTVKPVALMRQLIKLVNPAGGTVLDPFTGSGTTGVAALYEGANFIGCELTEEYLPIIHRRLSLAQETITVEKRDTLWTD